MNQVGSPADPSSLQRGILRDRLPGIVGGTAVGMFTPVLAVAGSAALVACHSGGGGGGLLCAPGCQCGPCGSFDCGIKPTSYAAFAGSLVGSVTGGTMLGHTALAAAHGVVDASLAIPVAKGWALGGPAGAVGAVGITALGEATYHAYKSHKAHGEYQRQQTDLELGLRDSAALGPYPPPPNRPQPTAGQIDGSSVNGTHTPPRKMDLNSPSYNDHQGHQIDLELGLPRSGAHPPIPPRPLALRHIA